MSTPRKALLVLADPPPISTGLGTLWGKLATHLPADRWQIDFVGVDPRIASPLPPSPFGVGERGHYVRDLPLARRSSVERNRGPRWRRGLWTLVRAAALGLERAKLASDFDSYLSRRLPVKASEVLDEHSFDLIAVHSPPLSIAEPVSQLARTHEIPFLLIVGDPLGARTETDPFTPHLPDLQQSLIDSASGVLMPRATYELHYRPVFDLDPAKVSFFSDCFVDVTPDARAGARAEAFRRDDRTSLLHWGAIDTWRPIHSLVDAIDRWNRRAATEGQREVDLVCMGWLERSMRERAERLGDSFYMLPLRPYEEARKVALAADILLTVVGPRHRDNVPSKFVDSLAYGRPQLVLAPEGAAIEPIVSKLGVGLAADVTSADSIYAALSSVTAGHASYARAYETRAAEIGHYHARSVAARLADSLDSIVERSRGGR